MREQQKPFPVESRGPFNQMRALGQQGSTMRRTPHVAVNGYEGLGESGELGQEKWGGITRSDIIKRYDFLFAFRTCNLSHGRSFFSHTDLFQQHPHLLRHQAKPRSRPTGRRSQSRWARAAPAANQRRRHRVASGRNPDSQMRAKGDCAELARVKKRSRSC